jgi:hypothetical protein
MCQECKFITVSKNSPLFSAAIAAESVTNTGQSHITETRVTANVRNNRVNSFTIEQPNSIGTAFVFDVQNMESFIAAIEQSL